jgi:hypothetical protein
MRCSNCGGLSSSDDNFCRKCGATLRNVRLPAARNGSNLPAVSRGGSNVLPAMAQGAAIFALSAAFPILVRVLASRAVRLPLVLVRPFLRLPSLSTKKTARAPVRRDELEDEPGVIYAFRETVFIKKIPLRR